MGFKTNNFKREAKQKIYCHMMNNYIKVNDNLDDKKIEILIFNCVLNHFYLL